MAATSVSRQWKYDVFVSFRGEDIRKSFMDHLFKDFRQKGIHAFRDDKELPRGEDISPQLYKAIEESRFLIVIFSKNYASSSWCLKELVKILECKQIGKHEYHVRIIFYDVKPAVVRNQTESYAKAFTKHEFANRTEVVGWKEALFKAANFSGWDLQDMANGYESKLIDSISKEILETLCVGPLHIGENLVGVDARVSEMNLLRFVGSGKVHMIGICGVGGIGKTTLAKAIYNLMYIHFEQCIFLDDVQEATKRHGLAHVVMKLVNDIMKTTDVKISNIGQGLMVMRQRMASRRILFVVDGVDHQQQLEALAGSCDWFFPGSLIIFTSKDRRLLTNKVDEIYDMKYLHDAEALELFSLYAFKQKHPTEGFKELTNQVVNYVQGHPLALKVLGCFLCGQTVHVWTSELDKLQTYPNADLQQVLRLGFDGLDFTQRRVFLDIASYLVGENKDFATSILDGCNFYADTTIRVLVDRSLITISSLKSLEMHNLIQSMAREIVREESERVGKRSRLWIQSEVCDVLNRNKVTEAVEVLVVSPEKSSQNVHIDCKSFTRMNNLRILIMRYLELKNFDYTSELNPSKESKVKFFGRLEFLSNELRLLFWQGCPFRFLPSKFYPENIVAIDMSYSHIKNLWATPKCFKKLKTMTLRHCHHLTNTPDFTEITNLEKLILEGCVNLVDVHPSIGMLKRLVVLNMRNCRSLRSFPCEVELDSLEVLIISGCSKVEKWPKTLGTIKTLTELHVDVTTVNHIPSFLFSLSNLQTLSISRHLGNCSWWTSIFRPSFLPWKWQHPQSFVLPSFTSLRTLRELDIRHCNIFEMSPDCFEGLSCLQVLNLTGNNFSSLPASLSQLSGLRCLVINYCKKLEGVPELAPSVVQVFADGCTSLHKLPEVSMNPPINDLICMRRMELLGCEKLVEKHTIESLLSMLLPNQGLYPMHREYDMFLPGNRIPRWFTHQSLRNYVMVNFPPDWCSDKFGGYEICVVFTLKIPPTEDVFPIFYVDDNTIKGNILHRQSSFYQVNLFRGKWTRDVGSNMIWLRYSTKQCYWMKADNIVGFSFACDNYEVKQCGVRFFSYKGIQEKMDPGMTIKRLRNVL